MLEWVYHTADRVAAEAKEDPEYRELAERQRALAPEYEALLDRLSPEDRELILEYTDVAGNLQYRMTQLAYRCGKREGRTEKRRGDPRSPAENL